MVRPAALVVEPQPGFHPGDTYSLSTVLDGSQDGSLAQGPLLNDAVELEPEVPPVVAAVPSAVAPALARVPGVQPASNPGPAPLPLPSPGPPPPRPAPVTFRVKVRDYREKHLHRGHASSGDVVVLGKEHSAILGDASIRVRTLGGASLGWVDHPGVVKLGAFVGSAAYTVQATYERLPYNYKQQDRFGGPEAVVVVQGL